MPGRKKKKTYRLTGSSNTRRDRPIRAKPPGRRTSASGRRYTETRRNRADARPRRGL